MEESEVIAGLNKAYFSEERHEKNVLNRLGDFLASARVFVDVGASLGQYTFYANKIIRQGRIYAIEADPLRYRELAKTAGNGNPLPAIN